MVIMVRITGIKPLKFLSFPSQLTVNGEFKSKLNTSIAFQTTKTSLYHIFIVVFKNCLLDGDLFSRLICGVYPPAEVFSHFICCLFIDLKPEVFATAIAPMDPELRA